MSEPNRKIIEDRDWLRDEKMDATIAFMDGGRAILESGSGTGFIWVELTGV